MPTTLTSAVDGTQFVLDGCFGEFWATDKIYSRLLNEPVSALLDGYNLTLFAYGQTGSGKTHTMLGNSTEAGLLQLAVQQLFEALRARKEAGWQCTATLSAIEVRVCISLLTILSVYNVIKEHAIGVATHTHRFTWALPPRSHCATWWTPPTARRSASGKPSKATCGSTA